MGTTTVMTQRHVRKVGRPRNECVGQVQNLAVEIGGNHMIFVAGKKLWAAIAHASVHAPRRMTLYARVQPTGFEEPPCLA